MIRAASKRPTTIVHRVTTVLRSSRFGARPSTRNQELGDVNGHVVNLSGVKLIADIRTGEEGEMFDESNLHAREVVQAPRHCARKFHSGFHGTFDLAILQLLGFGGRVFTSFS